MKKRLLSLVLGSFVCIASISALESSLTPAVIFGWSGHLAPGFGLTYEAQGITPIPLGDPSRWTLLANADFEWYNTHWFDDDDYIYRYNVFYLSFRIMEGYTFKPLPKFHITPALGLGLHFGFYDSAYHRYYRDRKYTDVYFSIPLYCSFKILFTKKVGLDIALMGGLIHWGGGLRIGPVFKF